MRSEVNLEAFANALHKHRDNLSLREAVEEIGNISASTLSRLENGMMPDLETYVRVCRWLGVPVTNFIYGCEGVVASANHEKAIVSLLRSDSVLDHQTSQALVVLVQLAYARGDFDDTDNLRTCIRCGQYETTSSDLICWHCKEQDVIDKEPWLDV